jgi:hypothetical protein
LFFDKAGSKSFPLTPSLSNIWQSLLAIWGFNPSPWELESLSFEFTAWCIKQPLKNACKRKEYIIFKLFGEKGFFSFIFIVVLLPFIA